jgi:predicted GH43/DUF377 family glycosyl hydrolase
MKIVFSLFVFFGSVCCASEVDLAALAEKESRVITTKRLVFDEFPDAFNPSIIDFGEGFLMTFRFSPDVESQAWINHIAIVVLDKDLNPLTKPQVLNTRQRKSKTPSQSEDARIFRYKGRLFLIYNDNLDQIWNSIWVRRDMFIAELLYENGQFKLSPSLKLIHEEKYPQQICQKNWIPFEWKGTLLFTFTLNPHEVISPNFSTGACYHCYETHVNIDWKYGTLRGSTPPIFVDGEYLAFFHSAEVVKSEVSRGERLWHYFMGAYTFSPTPPFQLTSISPEPIITEGFYTESSHNKRVIFPGGYVIRDDLIYVAYGKDDCEIWIATLDLKKLKSSLVPIKN